MYRKLLPLLLILCSGCLRVADVPTRTSQTHPPLQVMTYNIRLDHAPDGIHAWPNRKDVVASLIRFYEVDLLGVQEALRHQLSDLEARLPGYTWLGAGRDDGKEAGEFSAVFYRTDRFELLAHDTFWLSETPDVPGSKSWDAAITRVATWGRLRDRTTGQAFFFLNTHFDHIGQQARAESARLLVEKIPDLAEGLPVIVTGDFNATPEEPPYAVMTGALQDTRAISSTPPYGPAGTWATFTVVPESLERRIDYIFVSDGVRVLRHGTLADSREGRYPSDHLPVITTLALPQ